MLVPAALAGEGLVIPIGSCSRGSPPQLPSARARRHGSSLSEGFVEVAVAPCVVSSSENYSVLVSTVAMLPQGPRYAVDLAIAFWRVFPELCLGGSGGGSPRTSLRCFCSSACCGVLSDSPCCLVIWVVHSGEGSSQDRPLSLLAEVLPRSALFSFRATVVFPLWFEVCCLVGLRFGEVLPRRILALLVEVLPKAALFPAALAGEGL
ncbi:hypothetical protein Taro_028420, partial [Colocasia esculenta]|nr:hypothetical protein [Colocasia esculenta]